MEFLQIGLGIILYVVGFFLFMCIVTPIVGLIATVLGYIIMALIYIIVFIITFSVWVPIYGLHRIICLIRKVLHHRH